MGGRQHDSAPAAPREPVAIESAPTEPPSVGPASIGPVSTGSVSVGPRGRLVVALVLAAGGTAAALLTDDPLTLRLALLAVCWAFVAAAFLAGDRRADHGAAAAREAELRHAYDLELEREVAARHTYQAELEGRLRREAEEAMRAELVQLRIQLAGLAGLRDELSVLPEVRSELAGLAELRSDLGRMRTELSEQLSGELLVERMVMRAQSVRGAGQPAADRADGRALDGASSWETPSWETPSWETPSREVPSVAAPSVEVPPRDSSAVSPAGPWTGGWDVGRWAETQVVPAERVEPAPRPPAGTPPVPPPSPADRGADTGSYDGAAYDELLFGTAGVSSSAASSSTARRDESPSYEPSVSAARPAEPAPSRVVEPPGHARLEQILAESGVPAPTGARSRRRRYRDEDGGTAGDDVLARVLGRS